MSRSRRNRIHVLAALALLSFGAPVLAVPDRVGEPGRTIEAPGGGGSGGVGFVLLMSLRRA